MRPQIPFEACLEAFLETEDVPKFYSTAAKKETFAKKTMRLKTFPDFLMIQLLKFAVDDSWVPYKLDIEVGMPDHLELSKLAGAGLQPGEEVLPDDEPVKKEVSENCTDFGQFRLISAKLQFLSTSIYDLCISV